MREPSVKQENRQILRDYEPTADEAKFLRDGSGVFFPAKAVSRFPEKALQSSETQGFAKWLRVNNPAVAVQVEKAPMLALHSNDYWFPLAVLGSDTAAQFYIGMVVNYVYDRLKGALKHDTHLVHLAAIYEDKPSGKVKKFIYTGPVEGLKACMKKIDLNEFLGD